MRKTDLPLRKGQGILYPIVDFNKCSGKGPCVQVCPYNVYEMRQIENEDRILLNFIGKLKTRFNENKAYVIDADACNACGLCVTACTEKAIKLRAK